GVPVDLALAKVALRFRGSQQADGSWHYFSAMSPGRTPPGTPAMTCAALLGLAVGHGAQPVLRTDIRNRPNDALVKQGKSGPSVGNDFAVRTGLLYLARHIGSAGPRTKNRPKMAGAPLDYYFLWSLERVGMIYGLKTIGKKDWYAWGSQTLLDHQSDNGS